MPNCPGCGVYRSSCGYDLFPCDCLNNAQKEAWKRDSLKKAYSVIQAANVSTPEEESSSRARYYAYQSAAISDPRNYPSSTQTSYAPSQDVMSSNVRENHNHPSSNNTRNSVQAMYEIRDMTIIGEAATLRNSRANLTSEDRNTLHKMVHANDQRGPYANRPDNQYQGPKDRTQQAREDLEEMKIKYVND